MYHQNREVLWCVEPYSCLDAKHICSFIPRSLFVSLHLVYGNSDQDLQFVWFFFIIIVLHFYQWTYRTASVTSVVNICIKPLFFHINAFPHKKTCNWNTVKSFTCHLNLYICLKIAKVKNQMYKFPHSVKINVNHKNAMPPEGPKITRVQYWFSGLVCCTQDTNNYNLKNIILCRNSFLQIVEPPLIFTSEKLPLWDALFIPSHRTVDC